jgi:hypothetical protein
MFTKGQSKFLENVANGVNCSMHTRVMKPLWDAGYIFPRPGNTFAWLVGCNSQNPAEFYLTEAGWALFGITTDSLSEAA